MTTADVREQVSLAVSACEDKKAEDLRLLQLDKDSSAFTDFFVICSGTNPRQIQAISDEVELRLKRAGTYPNQIEGYNQAEWVLMDYVDFVIHIFSENARKYYDLERLWKSAKALTREELLNTRAKVTESLSAGGGEQGRRTAGGASGKRRAAPAASAAKRKRPARSTAKKKSHRKRSSKSSARKK